MNKTVWQDTAVITKDKYLLGQTHAFFNRVPSGKPHYGPYPTYLVVKNFTIGDDFYIPTEFVDVERSSEQEIWLSITDGDIREKQFSIRPVDDAYEKVELPMREGSEQVVITSLEGRDDIKQLG